jgi:glycosyltransferase involved in cell wall biosynthesis
MTTTQVTVLITTYNYGQFIEQAIDSVLSQDFPQDQMQILVIDDGSTDDTAAHLKKYGSRVEYFYQPNGGQASALNLGFAKTRGEIVALLDADDFFLPGKLAAVAHAFASDSALGMVYHRLREWHVETDTYSEWDFRSISGDICESPDFFLSYEPHPTSCLAFRRNLVDPFLPIPEDIRMLADCFPAALIPFRSPVLAVPEFLSIYRIHRENSYYAGARTMSPEVRNARLKMWHIVIPAMFKWLADNGYTRKQQPVRVFLDRWTLYIDNQEFALQPPGRLRFFRHLMRYSQCYGPQMTWRLRIINDINAICALFTGYRHFHVLNHWRLKLTGRF